MFWSKAKTKPVEKPCDQHEITVPVVCDCKARQEQYIKDVDRLTAEITKLQSEKILAQEQLEKAKLDHKITVEDIKHMQKMLDEKNKLELDRKVFEAEKKASEKIDKIKDEYKDKLEKDLMERQKEITQLYEKIMEALPNVNVSLKGKV